MPPTCSDFTGPYWFKPRFTLTYVWECKVEVSVWFLDEHFIEIWVLAIISEGYSLWKIFKKMEELVKLNRIQQKQKKKSSKIKPAWFMVRNTDLRSSVPLQCGCCMGTWTFSFSPTEHNNRPKSLIVFVTLNETSLWGSVTLICQWVSSLFWASSPELLKRTNMQLSQ